MVGPAASLALTFLSSANNLRPNTPPPFPRISILKSLSFSPSILSLMKHSNTTIPSSEPPESTDAALSEKPTVRGRRTRKMTISRDDVEECTEKDDDDDQFEKKIVALKKIVPGGETLAVENLFEETADYIASLQYKVEALRFLVTFVESSQNNQRKLGG